MNKYILWLFAFISCMTINAQVIKVYENNTLKDIYTNIDDKKYKVVFEEADNFSTGNFSVSPTKTVQLTKSNIYWDGSVFRFE